MTVSQTITPVSDDRLIRRALLANGTFSLVCGLLMLFDAQPIASLMGLPDGLAIMILGALIVPSGLVMLYFGTRSTINRPLAQLTFAVDVIWVLASVIILMLNAFDLSTAGRWLVFGIADVVLMFAIAEYFGLRRMQ